ncbi:MAG: sugar porter family MFS transporter [Chthoniobacterales bacterium]
MNTHPSTNNSSVVLISIVAAIGGFLFGFDSGVINGTVNALQEAFKSTSVGTGFNVASMLLGCAVGAFVAGGLADKFGRRPVMLLTAVFFGISAWGSGIAGGSGEFIIYRIIGGFAVGAASILCPAYISEIAPASIRGRLSSLQQLAIVLGLFMAFLSNYFIEDAAGNASNNLWLGYQAWQWMFWVELIPAVIFFAALFLIPESPRYLVAAGSLQKAASILQNLNPGSDSQAKVQEIQTTLESDHKPRMGDLYDKVHQRIHPVLWVGLGLAIFQQLVGINVVFYYGATLWEAAGFSSSNALLINVITGAVNIISTLVAIALIDKIGRKPLLIFGSVGMTIFLITLTIIFGTAHLDAEGSIQLGKIAGPIALLAANLYVFCFGVSWGPVMWVMLGEMFQNKFRGAALSVSGFAQWMANFSITLSFPLLLSSLGLGGAYGLYAFFALVSIFFVLYLVKETKGKELEDMGD